MSIFKDLRKERGLTQIELANILDVDQTTISKWELGKALPETNMLIKLSEFYDVSSDYLLGRSSYYYPDKINYKNPSEALSLTKQEQNLLQDFRKLVPEMQSYIENIVHSLAVAG